MEITGKGSPNLRSQFVKDSQEIPPGREKGAREVQRSETGAAQVNISSEARNLQRVANLVGHEGELRAEKVNSIREQIERGEYHVEAIEVARGIARSEISRLLGNQ
jgi:flagellar biosynthesis anti-sigma factor FlgM